MKRKLAYIGNCVECGDGESPINDVFGDATEMAQFLEGAQDITESAFKKMVGEVPKGAGWFGKRAGIYFAYDADKDVHYFYG